MRLRLRGVPKFLAAIFDGRGTKVRKDGFASYVDLDYLSFTALTQIDPTQSFFLVQNPIDGSFARVSAAVLITSAQMTTTKTTPGDVNVSNIDGVIIVNKTVGGATNVNLPKGADKVGPLLVTDAKRDAGTNNITIVPAAGETIEGFSTYVIAADGGSIFLRAVPGVGYVI